MIKLKVKQGGILDIPILITLVNQINKTFKKNRIKRVSNGLTMTQEADGVVIALDPDASPAAIKTPVSDGGGGGDVTYNIIPKGFLPTPHPINPSEINAGLGTVNYAIQFFPAYTIIPTSYVTGIISASFVAGELSSLTPSWIAGNTPINDPYDPNGIVRFVVCQARFDGAGQMIEADSSGNFSFYVESGTIYRISI